MSLESIITIVCSVAALIVAIIIGILQIRQSNSMERFEKRQNERDEKRYREEVHASACKYISKYYEQRGLIPLFAIASMYNDAYHYDRKMYKEFMWLNLDTRKEIMRISGFHLEIDEKINIFDTCLDELEKSIKRLYPEETKDLFYEGGKYSKLSLIRYGRERIPAMKSVGTKVVLSKNIPYKFLDYVTDMLAYHKEEQPISKICKQYHFNSPDEENACLIATVIAKYTAIYGEKESCDETIEYGSPGAWAGEELETMEDLFLSALFEIYVNLVL